MARSLCLLGCSSLAPEGKWEIMLFATINSDFYRPTSILMLDGLRGIRCCFPLCLSSSSGFLQSSFPPALMDSTVTKGGRNVSRVKHHFFFFQIIFLHYLPLHPGTLVSAEYIGNILFPF